MVHPDKILMERIIKFAKEKHQPGGHAIGALVAKGDEIIAEAIASVREEKDGTCHAEMNALRLAMKKLDSCTLKECYLYTTFEPCPMCTSAAIWAKMKGIVYGASREDRNEHYPWRVLIPCAEVIERSEPKLEFYQQFMHSECRELLKLI